MIETDRVLLLQAPVPGAHNRLVAKPSAIAPLGLGYLAAVLIQDGFDVTLCDMDVEDVGVGELQQMLGQLRPGVVGISTATLTLKNGLRVARVVKDCHRDGVVVVGGPHVSVVPDDALCYPFVDVVVRGEGELTLLELCRAVSRGQRPPFGIIGTSERVDNGVVNHPARDRITDLDGLPFPARLLMPLDRYNIPGTVLTSRGCPFACGFCAGPSVLGRRYAGRSAGSVVSEVQTCIDVFGFTSFYFVDDTMTHDVVRLGEICAGLRQVRIPDRLGRELKWTCESRADVVSPEVLADMRAAGCTTIQFGLESGSQELLDRLGKRVTLEEIERAVAWSREVGISPVLSVVFPHPDETEATMDETFEFIRRLYDLGAEKIVPAMLTLFPGTRFFEQREQLGLTMLTEDTDEFNLGTPVLTTRNFDLLAVANGYSRLLILTQNLGGDQVGGVFLGNELGT